MFQINGIFVCQAHVQSAPSPTFSIHLIVIPVFYATQPNVTIAGNFCLDKIFALIASCFHGPKYLSRIDDYIAFFTAVVKKFSLKYLFNARVGGLSKFFCVRYNVQGIYSIAAIGLCIINFIFVHNCYCRFYTLTTRIYCLMV